MIPLIAIAVIVIFLTGFWLGSAAQRNWEDTELLDALDYHQFDLDRWNTKAGEPGWRTYHPAKNHSYVVKSFPNVRDAIRDFVEHHAQ